MGSKNFKSLSTKTRGPIIFRSKKLWIKTFLDPKKFGSDKILVQKSFDPKNYSLQKIRSKIFGQTWVITAEIFLILANVDSTNVGCSNVTVAVGIC